MLSFESLNSFECTNDFSSFKRPNKVQIKPIHLTSPIKSSAFQEVSPSKALYKIQRVGPNPLNKLYSKVNTYAD